MERRIIQGRNEKLPSVLGGTPSFGEVLPITRPTTADFECVSVIQKEILSSGILTNGKYVKKLEDMVSEYLGVKNVIAVSSCTSGLMLALKVLGLKGEVILPSFTFFATAHAARWNNLSPVFADCSPDTFNIDLDSLRGLITKRTSTLLAVHVFGNPANVEKLEQIAVENDLKLIFDSAHGFGSIYKGKMVGGFGDAEVFSLSPTKLLVAGEGGLVTTNDDVLAEKIRVGRDYGNTGDYDPQLVGLNARMAEFNAALAIKNLETIEFKVQRRNDLASVFMECFEDVPGIFFQKVEKGIRSTYKDLSVIIDENLFGLSRDELAIVLEKENIMTKKYYFPPVHKQRFYRSQKRELPVTDKISRNIISLPFYSHMPVHEVEIICDVIKRIHENASQIKNELKCCNRGSLK